MTEALLRGKTEQELSSLVQLVLHAAEYHQRSTGTDKQHNKIPDNSIEINAKAKMNHYKAALLVEVPLSVKANDETPALHT